MPRMIRPPLPTRAIPQEIVGHDTRAQAAENRRRVSDYLENLRATGTALPADPTQPKRLGTAQVALEAGVTLGVLRPDHPLRKQVEEAVPELGLATIHVMPTRDCLSVAESHSLFRSLAPAEAVKAGIVQERMIEFVDKLFELIRYRADDVNTDLVAPIVMELREEAATGALKIPAQVRRIISKFDEWLADSIDPGTNYTPDTLSTIAFHDLLSLGMERMGLSQAEAAEIAGIPQPTLHKWLRYRRSPNVRSHVGLRRLSVYFGFPPDCLINAVTRSQGGSGFQFRADDFPPKHRGKNARRVREAVRARLTEDDFHLSPQTFRTKIADLCAELQGSFQADLARKQMRDANRIVRDRFPNELKSELTSYQNDLKKRGRSDATLDSYMKHMEGFFSYSLSDNAPEHLRLNKNEASIVHSASRDLWEAYFTYLTEVGREFMKPGFKVSRAIVHRVTAVSALFNRDGYIDRSPELLPKLRALRPEYRPRNSRKNWKNLDDQERLASVHLDLNEVRKSWIKDQSQAPVNGRSEISDILAIERPMDAIDQVLFHLRLKKEKIRKWATDGDTKRLNHHYATALRKIILVHFLAQTALRIGMVPLITVGRPGCHLIRNAGGKPRLTIPAELFKNGTSEVFKDGPYQRDLNDWNGFYCDLDEYLDLARPRLLDGRNIDNLFLGWSAKNGCGPVSSQVTRHEIRDFTADAIGMNAPPEKRLIRKNHLRPHHFRDILATSVLKRTNRNFALAGDAIHVTEETARQYYAYDTVEQRRPELNRILADL